MITIIAMCIIIFVVVLFTPWTGFSKPDPTKYLEWEHNFNIARGVSKKKLDIQFIESKIERLKNTIIRNDGYIAELEERYPGGLNGFMKMTLRPDHFDRIELCGDEEVDNQYEKVLHEQHELEDRISAQDRIIKMYDKYCVQKDWDKNVRI